MIGDFGNFTPEKGLIPILKKKLLRGLKEERRRKCPAPSRIRSHNFINPLRARCRCATANEGRSAVREISRVSWSNKQKQMFSSMQPNSNMVSFWSLNSAIWIPIKHTHFCSHRSSFSLWTKDVGKAAGLKPATSRRNGQLCWPRYFSLRPTIFSTKKSEWHLAKA